jgi:hypothetical protein
MSVSDVFARIKSALDSAEVAYMLTGSFASASYGAPRSTQDIDFVIAATASQLRSLVRVLPSDQYYVDLDAAMEAYTRQSPFNVVDMATGWKIDFIIRKSRAFSEEEFSRRRLVELEGAHLFVATAEDVVIAKLEAGAIAKADRGCGGDTEGTMEVVGSILLGKMDR